MTIIFCDYDNLTPLITLKNKLKGPEVKFTHAAEPKRISEIMGKSMGGPLKALVSQVPVPISIKEDLAEAKKKNPNIKDIIVSKLPDGNINIHDMDTDKGVVIKNKSDFEEELFKLIGEEAKKEESTTVQPETASEASPEAEPEVVKPEAVKDEEVKKEEKSIPQKAKPLTNKDK